MKEIQDALHSIRVEHDEDLVVPFGNQAVSAEVSDWSSNRNKKCQCVFHTDLINLLFCCFLICKMYPKICILIITLSSW